MGREIKFWLDGSDKKGKKLVVFDPATNQTREIHHLQKIQQFLDHYGLTMEEMRGVCEGEDRLRFFNRKSRWGFWKRK